MNKKKQELKLHEPGEIIPNKPLVLSKESFKSQFFLVGADLKKDSHWLPMQVGPQLINEIIKLVSTLEQGERVVIRALKVDTKEEIEQRNKVLPEVEL